MAGSPNPVESTQFDPSSFRSFRFLDRSIDAEGEVRLRYGLDEMVFEERFSLPVPASPPDLDEQRLQDLLSLLHWVAGVSYYKAAVPESVEFERDAPWPAAAELLEALYSEGLGEFAAVNERPLPRPSFPSGAPREGGGRPVSPSRILVPVGGGKDSTVAIETVRESGLDFALFSIGDAPPIRRTVEVAGTSRFLATRRIDPLLIEANASGALNGHVPVTAIVSCVALVTAALHGYDGVALANERSASSGNTVWDGVEVNHQFSKGIRAERLLQAAVAESVPGMTIFSILRMASELTIARTFSRLPQYHRAFTSCNRIFQIDPALRTASWCCDCDKCRFVFLILAPFFEPDDLAEIFGKAMLDDPAQFDGFALLTATGGHKPFECVGEEEESIAAIRLLAADPRWNGQRNVRRLADEVLPRFGPDRGDLDQILALSDEHSVPSSLLDSVNALLGH